MNIKMILYTIGNLLKVEAFLLLLPLIVSLIYVENTYLSFLIPIILLLGIGFVLTIKKPTRKNLYAKEGFALVGLAWILLSLFGCMPFMISKEIPNFVDAFFETVSGFTTTGGSILNDVEKLSKGMLFWRSFTHWIGGMGVLVFVLAILPSSDGQNIFILRAESTGPQVGKLVSKVKVTARILYLIYLFLTVLQIIILIIGKMPVFDAILNSFSTAGTGGFGIKNDSIASYNSFCQITIAIFMLIFGINFNIFYLILIGKFVQAIKSEELRTYLSIIFVSVLIIFVNIITSTNISTTTALKDSFFQVTSIISSTGLSTLDYVSQWPSLAQMVLFILMFIGACAGSTGGGLKVSRVVILLKSFKREIKKIVHPNSVSNIRFEGTNLDETIVKGVSNYFTILIVIFVACTFILSINGFDFQTNITAVAACINNIGPGLGKIIGPAGNYSAFSPLSKITLIFAMLVGRLEIYPLLILFNPKIWANK